VKHGFQESSKVASNGPYSHPEESCTPQELPGTFFLHPASPRPELPQGLFGSDNGPVNLLDPNPKERYLQLNMCVAQDGSSAKLMRVFFWGNGFSNLELPGKTFEILKGTVKDLAFGTQNSFVARAKDSDLLTPGYSLYLTSFPGGFAATTVYMDKENGPIVATEGHVIVGTLQPNPPNFGAQTQSYCSNSKIKKNTLRLGDASITLNYCRDRDRYEIVSAEIEDSSRDVPRTAQGKRFVVEGPAVREATAQLPSVEGKLFGGENKLYFSSHHHFSCDALWISLPHASYAFTATSVVGGYGEECTQDVPNAPQRGRGSSKDLFFGVKYPQGGFEGSLRCDHFLDNCRS
jgi:hypothetical protein